MNRRKLPHDLRNLVKSRARYTCEYCLAIAAYAFHPFPIDHIVPLAKGGKDEPENLAYACQFCNIRKYDKIQDIDPLTGRVNRLFNPRLDSWSDHFVWSKNDTVIVGISPIGRATVASLDMNRTEAINLRRALRDFGVHPPAL